MYWTVVRQNTTLHKNLFLLYKGSMRFDINIYVVTQTKTQYNINIHNISGLVLGDFTHI